MTTPAVLGERVLRRLGVEIVPVAARPALAATVSVTVIAARALQGLGVPVAAANRPSISSATIVPVATIAERALQALGATVAEADRPTLTTVITVTAIAERALQALGVTVTQANSPPFTTTVTTAAIATGALIELGVIASDETPSATDQALALAKVLEVHDALVAQAAVAWASTGILQAAAEEYTKLTALVLASSFGKAGDPAQWPMLEARVKRVSLIAQSQTLAEARVNAVHDELVRNAYASWTTAAIPQAVADDYVALTVQQMAPLFGAQAPGVDATSVVEARVKRVALLLQAQDLAEDRVAAIHGALVGNGYASWGVAAIPQGVSDDYVALVRFELAPAFGVDLQAGAGLVPAIEARVKRYALVLQAQGLAEARVNAVHDELVGNAHVSWAASAIPQAVSDDYVGLTMIKLAPLFEIKADPAGIPALEARVRHFSLVQRAPDLATEAVMAVHADLGARGKLRWTAFDIPQAAEQPYILLAAFRLGPEFDRQVAPTDVIMAERALARMIALPTSGERVRTEYF